MYGRHKHLLYGRDNTDGFHLLDLNTGKILRQARIDRRNGTAKGGIGNEQIQFMIAAYDKNLFWLNWNAQTNTLEGAGETLRGAHGEPARPFDNVTHIDARFGSRSSYFVCNQNGQFAAYRADYRDRSVHLVRQGVRNLKFAPPFLLLQDGDAGHNRHRWTLRREDAPAYAHTLELAHTWQGQSTFINGRLLEVIPRQQQQPPALRIHDLHARKTLLTHSEPDSEKMGALPAGPDRILLYAYQRNKRDPAPYFRLTTYDLKTGQPGPTQTIDYWATTHHHPQEIRIVGKLLLARDPHALRAWELRI
jgi:hypothetical protein